MATNDRTEHGLSLTPTNDNHGDRTLKIMTPEEVRAALHPLVQLLARRAAHEWLTKAANDNSSKPPRTALSPNDTCFDGQE
jgi:hypothetical protein